jgi:hypothetical protein
MTATKRTQRVNGIPAAQVAMARHLRSRFTARRQAIAGIARQTLPLHERQLRHYWRRAQPCTRQGTRRL